MLFSILRDSTLDFKQKMTYLVFSLIIVVFSLTIHELSHALTASALGDNTAREKGRITLNPLKHLNPIGTIAMLLFGFGWAEPVPVNPLRFKRKHRMRSGMALTAVMGPVSNLVLSFIASFAAGLCLKGVLNNMSSYEEIASSPLYLLYMFFYLMHVMNLYLAVFNILPIPPLDGSKILFMFLPDRFYYKIMKYEQFIAIGLVVLLYVGVLEGPLSFITDKISNGMFSLVTLIIGS